MRRIKKWFDGPLTFYRLEFKMPQGATWVAIEAFYTPATRGEIALRFLRVRARARKIRAHFSQYEERI